MNVYLLLGSFNPPHAAHVQIGRWAIHSTAADQVWVVVCPQNPLKSDAQMAPFEDRVAMTRLAFQGVENICVMDFEKSLPAPHYTLNSIHYLIQTYPAHHFSILCGTDIINQLPQWHRIDELGQLVDFVEYPRHSPQSNLPQFDVSSSQIRVGDNRQQLDPKVQQYITAHNLYLTPLMLAQKLYADAQFGPALNALKLCAGTQEQPQADTLTQIIANILAFRNTDIYNP